MIDAGKLRVYLDEIGLSFKQNSISYIFDCPRCNKKDKLYIRKRDGRFVCWHCKETEGYQGKPEFALADLASIPISVVRAALYAREEIFGRGEFLEMDVGDFFSDGDQIDIDAVEIPTMTWPWDYYDIEHTFSKRGREYLAGRGIPLEIAKEYHLRFAPQERRVVFPVELGDRLVGWQERLVIPNVIWSEEKQANVEAQKVVSSTGIPTANTVMFANRMIGSEHVVVCEGPIDALKAHLCGGNICTMGKAIGSGQINAIRDPARLTKREIGQIAYSGIKKVYLALDPDAAQETMRLIGEFADLEVFLMHPPKPYKDIGEMSFDEVYALFCRARRVTTSVWLHHYDWK